MSTIEEAREQARKAEKVARRRVGAPRLGKSLTRETDLDILALRDMGLALKALLDATEPPVETGRIMLYHPDGSPKSNDEIRAEAEAASLSDQVDKPAEPMRDADGDVISSGEHRKIIMSGDSFYVCDTCTNVLGLNVRWDHASKREDHQSAVEPLPIKPAEDEREALVEVIRLFFQNWRSMGKVSAALEVSIDSLEGAVDDLIELGEPRPITDEMEYQVCDVHGEVWARADTLEEARHYAAQEPEGELARIEQRRVSSWAPVDEGARR